MLPGPTTVFIVGYSVLSSQPNGKTFILSLDLSNTTCHMWINKQVLCIKETISILCMQ